VEVSMTIRSFDLLQPRSLAEASALLLKHGDEARPIAGGTTLVILLKQRAMHYPYLVDLQSIRGLNQITQESDGVRIGALVTHRAVELSSLVRNSLPVVAEAFSKIGNVRVRQTATVGGNLAHADYRLDPPPALLLLGSQTTLFGPRGSRVVPLKDFFTGIYETVLEPGEILVDVKVPYMPAGSKAVYLRYSTLSANDWPCIGVAALLSRENDRCRELRLALSGLAPTPVLVSGLEWVRNQTLDSLVLDRLLTLVDEQIAPISDLRGSAWYKRQIAKVFVKRAIAQMETTAW
jgi:aerobic carbon-monoxide dehydrogenase medium subunit